MSVRLSLARLVCGPLPPIVAQRVRASIYPRPLSIRDGRSYVRRAATGSLLIANTRDFSGYPFAVHGYFDWCNVALAWAFAAPGDTVVEVGANIGTETVGFADVVGPRGEVWAFEPFPQFVAQLMHLGALNPERRIRVEACALGDEPGTVAFSPPHETATGIGHVVVGDAPSAERIEVPLRRLDDYAAELAHARVAALFIDTEGHDLRVLRGAGEVIDAHRPPVVLEVDAAVLERAGTSLDALFEWLERARYTPFVIRTLGLRRVRDRRDAVSANWCCLPDERASLEARATACLRRCACSPFVGALHPFSRVARVR